MKLMSLTDVLVKSLSKRNEMTPTRKAAIEKLATYFTSGEYGKTFNSGEPLEDPKPPQKQTYQGYVERGKGYCSDWVYLPQGAYPPQLTVP